MRRLRVSPRTLCRPCRLLKRPATVSSPSPLAALDQTREQAAAYYTSEYDRMLRDNADEIAPAYHAQVRGSTSQN